MLKVSFKDFLLWETDRLLVIALLLKSGKFSSGYITDDEYQSLRTLYRNRAAIQADMKDVKKRILTQIAVTFPELEGFMKPFSVTGLVLLGL